MVVQFRTEQLDLNAFKVARVDGRTAVTKSLGQVFSKGCLADSSSDAVSTKVRPHLEEAVAAYRPLLPSLLDKVDDLSKLPLWVTHYDLKDVNVLIDDFCNVTGVIDWELTRAALEENINLVQDAVVLGTLLDAFLWEEGKVGCGEITLRAPPKFLTYRIPFVEGMSRHIGSRSGGSREKGHLPTQLIGGIPATNPDIPVSAVLLFFFVAAIAIHVLIFFRNNRPPRNQKFPLSLILGVFCFVRTVALSLRIAWACSPNNRGLIVAATALTSAGVLILFVVNFLLVGRVVRALHPGFGWSKYGLLGFRLLMGTLAGTVIMVVVCSVHSALTPDEAAKRKERTVLLVAGVYITVLALLPALVAAVAKVLPNRGRYPAENFGTGSMRAKLALLVFTSVLLAFGAGFRVVVNFKAKPVGQAEWYHTRAVFYCINFVIELIVVYTYAISRFDQRFYVPRGVSAPEDHSRRTKGSQDGEAL
ncbi:hypothetical protein N657DRAFT_683895 [Parathielavia appendiculata]|uniref:Aminoglycoside phosphotransferase domain-containing protein n=1 Tax=Parathielavia appendiculata TaxID=2587402 RepID=A0AAN6YZP3_9PEZI|nr:hypothetical protein N657DRAFT_683895 [Parathielavia appendiculata]